MLKSVFIALSRNVRIKKIVLEWKPARLASRRFIAGETLEQAVEAVKKLNELGINATVDQLGENTIDLTGATQSTNDVINIIDAIVKNNLRANVSVKLSQIGMNLDDESCTKNLSQILDHAKTAGVFVRIDMEGSDLTEKTFLIYRSMIQTGFSNVGIVLQSYLYRTENDIEELNKWGGRVRLCKGAYKEPASIAFPKKADVDANFDVLASMLLTAARGPNAPHLSEDGRFPPIPALATHDIKRIDFAKELINKLDLPHEAVEFQMLYGIRRDLQLQIVKEGYPMRVYVPFGTQWYPYFMRRLAERPANMWFFMSSFFRK
jgi:proline dehydrogenase